MRMILTRQTVIINLLQINKQKQNNLKLHQEHLTVLYMKAVFRLINNFELVSKFNHFIIQIIPFLIGIALTVTQFISSLQIHAITSQNRPQLKQARNQTHFIINLIFSIMMYILMEERPSRIKYASHILILVNIIMLFNRSILHPVCLLCLTLLTLTNKKIQVKIIQDQSKEQKLENKKNKTSIIQVNRKIDNKVEKLVNFKTPSGNTVKSSNQEEIKVNGRRKIKMVSIIQNMEDKSVNDKQQDLNDVNVDEEKTQKFVNPSTHRRSHLVIKQIQRITNPRQYYKRRKTQVILSKIKKQKKQQFDPYAWSQMHDLNSCGSSFSATSSAIQIKHQKPYLMKSQNIPEKEFDAMSRLQSQRLKSLVEIRSVNQDFFVCEKLDTALISKEYFDYENQPYHYIIEKLREVFMKQIPQQQAIFTVKLETFQDFLRQLGSLYNSVPYHNITHAFDVMTTIDKYLNDYGNILHKIQLVREEKIGRPNDLQIQMLRIICLITAYAHDCGHEGFTSAFYLNTHDDLAINHLYESPLEQMHTSNLLALLRKYPVVMETICLPYRNNPDFNHISFEKEIKQLMIKMILATDNAKHFQMLQRFRQCKQKIRYLFQDPQTKRFNAEKLKKQEESMVFQMLLHSADLSNCTKDLQFLGLWTNHLYQEFKYQAAVEKQMGLPYSFGHIDFENANLSQIGFINGFVCPMISQICYIEPKFNKILQKAHKNAQYYRKKQDQKIKRFAKSDNELLAKIQSDKSTIDLIVQQKKE